MAQQVAIEILNHRILGVVSRSGSGRNQIVSAFSLDLVGDDPEQWGEQLKDKLPGGSKKMDLIAMIGRNDAEVREVVVPPAPDDEVPAMVRFKARADFASFNENWLLDFVSFENDPEKERHVLAAAVSNELQEQFQKIASGAGLKLKSMLFRPHSSVELLESRLGGTENRLVIEARESSTDIAVATGTTLQTTRTVRPGHADTDEELATLIDREIKRTLASSSSRSGDLKIDEIIYLGDKGVEFARALETQTGVPTKNVNPFSLVKTASGFATPEDPNRYSALLGAVRRPAEQRLAQIDFLNPRRKKEKKLDLTKIYWIAGSAAAALLLMGLAGWITLYLQSSKIAELNDDYRDQVELNEADEETNKKAAEQIIGEVSRIDEFLQKKANWIDQLYLVSNNSGTSKDAKVMNWAYSARTSDDVTASLQINGHESNEAKLLSMLNAGLLNAEKNSSDVKPPSSNSPYTRTFSIRMKPQRKTLFEIRKTFDRLAREQLMGEAAATSETSTPEETP